MKITFEQEFLFKFSRKELYNGHSKQIKCHFVQFYQKNSLEYLSIILQNKISKQAILADFGKLSQISYEESDVSIWCQNTDGNVQVKKFLFGIDIDQIKLL